MDSVLSNEVARRIAADLTTLVSEAEKHGTLPRIKSVAIYFNETELRTIIKLLRSCHGILDPAQCDAAQPQKLGISFSDAMEIAEDGLRRWREKDHNAKWWRKIDGTPIPNDLLVNIAQSMCEVYVRTPAAPEDQAAIDEIERLQGLITQLRAQVETANARLRQLKDSIDTRINNLLCETKPNYDDSIVGINDAWDVVRKACDEYIARAERPNG